MIMVIKNMKIMKNRLKNIVLIIGVVTLLGFNACKKSIDPVIEDLSFNRAFTPVGLKSEITNITNLKLSWTAAKNIDHYVVEIYFGTEALEANLLHSEDVTSTTFLYSLPSGDTDFSARIKCVSSVEGVTESKWSSITFKTPAENLFTGFKVTMTGLNAITVKWTPGKAVTKLLFINNTVETPYDVSPAEATAGSKDLTGVTNGYNEIRIMNSTFVRGAQHYLLEGDVLLESGTDLVAAITAASPGQVIVLRNGGSFGFVGNYTVAKSIKIKGIHTDDLPVIYNITTASVYHMFTIGSGLTSADSMVFENLNISGFNDNNSAAVRLRGMFDQQLIACNIGAIKFNNCVVRNFDRHAIRLRGDFAQVVNSIEINNCIMFDYAFGSNYGVINSSAALGTINNIKITNSTIYYIRGSVVNYQNGTSCNGITITNCTFNQLAQDAATGRYLVDMNATVSSGNITISNCLFGSTGTLSPGIRPNTMTLSMSGCYYTSDFVDDGVTYTIKPKMTAYSGASTGLWTNPVSGTFTFLDPNFIGKSSAGDPRWR
jgi:hypothetical protein